MHRESIIGLIQFERRLEDKDYNLRRAIEFIAEAADQGAQYIALPELFNTGFFPGSCKLNDAYFDLAETIPGPTTEALSIECSKRRIWIVAPLFERDLKFGIFYNSAAIIGPHGVIGKYRKRHIPTLSNQNEKHYFTPGNISYPVFELDKVRVGVSICYDRHFPETFRLLVLKGAEIVFSVNNTSGSPARSRRLWEQEIRVNCSSNGIFIGQVNAVREELNFFGCSFVCSPMGELIKQLGEEEGILVSTINLEEIVIARLHYGAIRDTIWSDFGLRDEANP